MAKKLTLVPCGFEMSLQECPTGYFLYDKDYVGFKLEYTTSSGKIEAFCDTGEFYHGKGKVIPLKIKWEE